MTVTVPQLRAWDTDGLRSAGVALRAVSREIVVIASRVAARSVASQAWSGAAADAAERRVQRVRQAVGEMAAGLDVCGAVLAAAGEALATARRVLEHAEHYAAEATLRLGDDGTVAVPPVEPGLSPELLATARRLHAAREQTAVAVTALARQALAAAAEADRDAAQALDHAGRVAGLLAPATFGWLSSWAAALSGPALRVLLSAGLVAGVVERDLPRADAGAADVAAWWVSLSPTQQDIALRAYPGRLGALDGLPAEVRHQANLAVLEREWAALQAAVHARPHFERLADLRGRLAMVESVTRELTADPVRRRLLLLDLDVGLAAIAIGDVDRADHVALVVPGLEQDVADDLDAVVYNADRLGRTAQDWLGRLAPHESVATVAWLGYTTPSWRTVASAAAAERGGRQLRSALRGLHAARATAATAGRAGPLHLTVVGHSYGTLAAAIALRKTTGTDDAVLVGSPGVDAAAAAEVGVPVGRVFVGESRGDSVADLAWFGRDPGSRSFGAANFQTDGGVDPVTGADLRASHGHSEYFDLRTESVRNMALVAIGQAHHVTYAAPSRIAARPGSVPGLLGGGARW